MLPRSTTLNGEIIPKDRIVGSSLTLVTKGQTLGDLFAHSEARDRIDREIAEHTKRRRQNQRVPLWHHWRIGRLAINWRWCNGR